MRSFPEAAKVAPSAFRRAECFVWPWSSGDPSTAELRLETPEVRRQCVGRNPAACIFGLQGWLHVNILIGHVEFCDQLYSLGVLVAAPSPITLAFGGACVLMLVGPADALPLQDPRCCQRDLIRACLSLRRSAPAPCVLQRRHCDTNAPAQQNPGTCSTRKRMLTVSAN